MLDVWLQCRQVRGRCDRSTLDLGNVLVVLSHHLVGQLEMAGVHRRFTNVSVHQLCKLLQLFHHTSLDVLVVTYLPKCFVEPGIPLQLLFMGPHLSLAFEGAGVIIWKHSSRGEWHSSLLSETQPGEIILCWESLCAFLILCPGIQSTWLNEHGAVELFKNMPALRSPSLTDSFSQRNHSVRKGQRKTFYEGNDVVARLMLLVLFHLPEDGGW